MGKIYTGSAPLSKVYDVSINAPLDNRTAVRYVADLTTGENDGIAAQVYKGMIVYVQEDNSLYIYTGQSNSTWKTSKGKLVNGGDINNWQKVDSFLLAYYQEKLGAKILDSTDEFSTIENPFSGQFAYVKDGSEASDDESGLYIYAEGTWTRILTGSGEVTGDFVKREELADYLKKDELPDFLTASDLDDYVKVEDLDGYLTPEDIADLASKSDLEGFIKIEDLPDFLTASDLDDFATKRYVDKKISDLIGGAPETLDTLKEIAEALEDNATMAQVAEAISTKANAADVYTKEEVDAKIDALPTEGSFPDITGSEEAEFTPGLATVEGVIDYVGEAIEQATPDLSDYALKSDVPYEIIDFTGENRGVLTDEQLEKLMGNHCVVRYQNRIYHKAYTSPNGFDYRYAGQTLADDDVTYYYFTVTNIANKGYTFGTTVDERPRVVGNPEIGPQARVEPLEAIRVGFDIYTIPEAPTKVSELDNDEGYLKSEDLPDFLTESDLDDYVKVEDLTGYLTEDDIADLAKKSDLDGYVKTEDLDGYLTPEDIEDLAKKSDLDGYVKIEDAVDFLTSSDLDDYATKRYVDKKIEDLVGGAPETLDTLKEIAEALEDNATMEMVADAISTKANAADVYTKTEVDDKVDELNDKIDEKVAELNDKIDALPDEGSFPDITGSDEAEFTPGLATVEGVIDYVADAIEQGAPDLSDYAKKSDIPEIPEDVSAFNNDAGYLTEHQDLSDYAKKEDLDDYIKVEDLIGYLTEEDIADLAKKSDLDGYVKKEDADEYLTASDLDDYALKSELPVVPTNVSEFINDAGYITLTDINPANYLTYYQEKLGAKVVDSFEDLLSSSISSAYAGMFAVVKGDASGSESEDDSGLYVLLRTPNTLSSNWHRVLTGDGSTTPSGVDVSEFFKFDGSAPTSGNGFSISSNQSGEETFLRETYVDDYLHAGVYYTTKGINSSKDNGGSELEGVHYIELSKGGDSFIRLYDDGTMRLNIVDESLGFNLENISSIITENGVENATPYAGQPYNTPGPMIPLGDGAQIKFDVDIDFTGMTEIRDGDSTEYVFGQTGSTYADIDFYTIDVLPTVYAYSNDTSVRVLTEGDKLDIVDNLPEPISQEEILGLF